MEQRTEQLQAIIAESALTEIDQNTLIGDFAEAVNLAQKWEEEAKKIVVTDESQVGDMQIARAARLELRDKRIAVEKTRKVLKDESLRRGQAIDKVAKFVTGLIVPTEQYLDDQEHFVENKQKAEEEARRVKADQLLRQLEADERKAQEEEAKKAREENARLRKEAEEKEASHRAELNLIAEEQAKKDATAKSLAAEAVRAAAVEARRDAEEKARIAAAKAKLAREEAEEEAAKREADLKEKLRLARMMTCPHCGFEFDSEEGKKNG